MDNNRRWNYMSTNWKILYATTENPASVGETFNANATEENLGGESSVNTELEAKANAERMSIDV